MSRKKSPLRLIAGLLFFVPRARRTSGAYRIIPRETGLLISSGLSDRITESSTQPSTGAVSRVLSSLVNAVTAESYKKECQEKNLPFGSMPVDFLSRHSAQLPERALLF